MIPRLRDGIAARLDVKTWLRQCTGKARNVASGSAGRQFSIHRDAYLSLDRGLPFAAAQRFR